MAHVRTRKLKDASRTAPGMNAHCMVAEVAVEMANELFEVYMQENTIYRKMRANGEVSEKAARKLFVERTAPRLLEDARQALTSCLSAPDDRVSPHMKEEIYQALLLDSDLRANRFVAESQAIIPGYLH